MKKQQIINLIKYHVDNNNAGFINEALNIAKEFDSIGDKVLSNYICSLLSSQEYFTVQSVNCDSEFLQKVVCNAEQLPIPNAISDDLKGIMMALKRNLGMNKFLFQGPPGTGKTESVKQVARIMEKELFLAKISALVDSKLGQTSKNISLMFDEIRKFAHPENVIILFDELDALCLDRTDQNDIREMGRATTEFFKSLDELDCRITLIATTNLFSHFDEALIRRFDAVIDFSRYSEDDLKEIALKLYLSFSDKFKLKLRDVRLFTKIVTLSNKLPYPGDLKNIIKASIAFSDPNSIQDHLIRIYKALVDKNISPESLYQQGFSLREIELLTGISKSTLSRQLKKLNEE